jgi:hypothetical protein
MTGSTTAKGLGWAHQQRRARLLPAAIGQPCPIRGPRCDGIMLDPRRMDLDHSLARALGGTVGDRIVCSSCNRWLGAKLGNALRRQRSAMTRAMYQRW